MVTNVPPNVLLKIDEIEFKYISKKMKKITKKCYLSSIKLMNVSLNSL